MADKKQENVFSDLKEMVDKMDDMCINDIESLCLNCGSNGNTRLLFTQIPFFREVVIMSFECPDCGWKNNELQPASKIQEKGVTYDLKCTNIEDLSRQVVKTEWSEIEIPELEMELKKQAGLITTIEGLIDRALEGIGDTLARMSSGSCGEVEPGDLLKLSSFLSRLRDLKDGRTPFTFVLSDPTGNSYVENLRAPDPDPALSVTYFERTIQQERLIGLRPDEDPVNGNNHETIKEEDEDGEEEEAESRSKEGNPLDVDPKTLFTGEVLEFPTNCNECNSPCSTRMKVTDIPHFKQVIIMATNCEVCGSRTNEVKSGTACEEKGVKITIHLRDPKQLSYDVVKSDCCSLDIPEVELELSSSGSGRYTTVEGLITHIKGQLTSNNPFISGDSAAPETRDRLDLLLNKLDHMMGLTIILTDPSGNTYLEHADETIKYERSWQDNEDLGLNDMKTENYSS